MRFEDFRFMIELINFDHTLQQLEDIKLISIFRNDLINSIPDKFISLVVLVVFLMFSVLSV